MVLVDESQQNGGSNNTNEKSELYYKIKEDTKFYNLRGIRNMNLTSEDSIVAYLDIDEYNPVNFYNKLFDDNIRRHISIYPETIFVQLHNIEKNMSLSI